VILTGASSQLGAFLIPRLISKGFKVFAVSRQVSGLPSDDDENPAWVPPDVFASHPDEAASEAMKRSGMFVSCGPLDVACTVVSGYSGLRRVVAFSTSSVHSKASSPDREESDLIRSMIEQESRLKRICQRRNLPLLIVRPTLIYGCGLDRNISRLASWIRRYRWLPLAAPAKGLRQPVHADDLARLAVTALMVDQAVDMQSAACGGSTLSYREMVERIFKSLGLPPRMVRLPPWLMTAIVGVLARLHMARGINREMILRQNLDLVFDDSVLRRKLNYEPRPFRPTAADYELPPSAMEFQALVQGDASGEKN
jgi:nucleoside-diphosphate-sugar epimerase